MNRARGLRRTLRVVYYAKHVAVGTYLTCAADVISVIKRYFGGLQEAEPGKVSGSKEQAGVAQGKIDAFQG